MVLPRRRKLLRAYFGTGWAFSPQSSGRCGDMYYEWWLNLATANYLALRSIQKVIRSVERRQERVSTFKCQIEVLRSRVSKSQVIDSASCSVILAPKVKRPKNSMQEHRVTTRQPWYTVTNTSIELEPLASKSLKLQKGAKKTYNSWDSLVVTHPTTNQPIWSLCMAERTGCPILFSLWSYVMGFCFVRVYISNNMPNSLQSLRTPASGCVVFIG